MSKKSNGTNSVTLNTNSSLNGKELKNQRHLSSALPTFFKWFKKSNHRKSLKRPINSTQSAIESQYDSSSRESLNSSPNFNRRNKFISPSISCDSVISTSTTGFSYIKPNNYKPNQEPKILINNEELNDNHVANENLSRPQITLRQKYSFLFETDTLKANNDQEPTYSGNYDNVDYSFQFDRSLPSRRKGQSAEPHPVPSRRNRRQRRTVSDSSKDKKAGAYVHVKGKRKAPGPPVEQEKTESTTNKSAKQEEIYNYSLISNQSLYGTLSSSSTLNRKKRRAPPPPNLVSQVSRSPSTSYPSSPNEDIKFPVLMGGLLDDKEIKEIINRGLPERNELDKQDLKYDVPKSTEKDNINGNLENIEQSSSQAYELSSSNQKFAEKYTESSIPSSSITPRPWYKRSITTNRDSIIPFKREIVLRTMEKRRKSKEQSDSNILPDVSYSRSSSIEPKTTSTKFGIFHRTSKDYSVAEKRKSAIGMPNISELDREAAEILNNENTDTNRHSNIPEHLILQQKMFVAVNEEKQEHDQIKEQENQMQNQFDLQQNDTSVNVDENRQCKSTKDLITKFESNLNHPKVTLNPAFLDKSKEKSFDEMLVQNNKNSENSGENLNSNLDSNEVLNDSKILNGSQKMIADKGLSSSKLIKLTWSCPYCTLENPNWRIICEVCEKLKPYEKLQRENDTDKDLLNKMDQPSKNNFKNQDQPQINLEWNRKAEQVKKYFMSSPKSSPEVTRKPPQSPISRKSPSPSKLPISNSPKLTRQRLHRIDYQDSKPNNILNNKIPKRQSSEMNILPAIDESKLPLLDSSVVITTVTPSYFAERETNTEHKNEVKETNLDIIRNARLARFVKSRHSTSQQQYVQAREESLSDPNSLEMEKQRLREKIRSMNAKAFAEKYPIIKKNISFDESDNNESTERSEFQDKDDINSKFANEIQEEITRMENLNNSGAIKKVLQKNEPHNSKILLYSKSENEIKFQKSLADNKPQKVSSSAQTPSVVKKPENYSIVQKLKSKDELITDKDPIYSNVATYENQIFGPMKVDKIELNNQDFDKLKEISQQLKSVKGITDLKASLKIPSIRGGNCLSRTDTLVLNRMMKNLESAIADGKHELAAKLAMDLAKMKVSLQVTKLKNDVENVPKTSQTLIIDMFVEDRVSQKGPIKITVDPIMTLTQLKEKAFKNYNIPKELQRWLINDEFLYKEDKTLQDYGIKKSGATLYLYIISPEKGKETQFKIPETSKALPEDDISSDSDSHNNEEDFYKGAVALPKTKQKSKSPVKIYESEWECPLCTLINKPMALACSACSKSKPLSKEEKSTISEELRNFINGSNNKNSFMSSLFSQDDSTEVILRRPEQKNDLNKATPNRKSTDIFNIIGDSFSKPETRPESKSTLASNSTSSAIVIGGTKKLEISQSKQIPIKLVTKTVTMTNFCSPNITKNKYRGVDNFNPYRKDVTSDHPERNDAFNLGNIKSPYVKNHYLELLKLDTSVMILNTNNFDCPICFNEISPGRGIILKDCLHTFCRDCLSNTINYNDEPQVKCPYRDKEYSCDSIIQDREIKGILNQQDYEKHLLKSIRLAENRIENAFHCKTPNCRGWCIYEDNVNDFRCPVCKIKNCLTCRVIHDGLTCKQYQDRLSTDCDSNMDARQTKDMLNEMVENGEAMNCPTCRVILMKKWGCDWLKCSMCKTEVCWVTRGARWGPGGKGDISAGCKCGVNGFKCHAKCNYCH